MLIVLSLRYLWTRGVCWGVVHSIVVVIPLVKSSSGLEILHGGEGGNVERWLEPQNKSLCLQLIYLSILSTLYSFTQYRSILLQQDCIEHLKLLSRGITRKKFRTLHGNTASNLALSDHLHHLIFILHWILNWLALHLFTPL